jgi:hypothetical protein
MFIFDASTLILIAKTEILDPFLRDLGFDVAIPLEVEKECCRVKKSLDALMIRKALDRESESSQLRIGSSLRECRKTLALAGVKRRLSCWLLRRKLGS